MPAEYLDPAQNETQNWFLMHYSWIMDANIECDAPLIYRIDVGLNGSTRTYVGQSVNAKRPLQGHLYYARKAAEGQDFSRVQLVHRTMADAVQAGGSLGLTLIENCPVQLLTERETFWWETLRPALNAAKPGSAGFKEMKRTPNRDKWFDRFLASDDWVKLKKDAPSGAWGAAATSFGARYGLAKDEALVEFGHFLRIHHKGRSGGIDTL